MHPLALIRALRPHQWVKNVFVLAAPVFAYGDRSLARAPGAEEWTRTGFAFLAFCFGASAIYLLNDCLDVEQDRAHPTKRNRPIAAGLVSVPLALATAVVCVLLAGLFALMGAGGVGVAGEGTIAWGLPGVVATYIAINLAYSVRLKHIVIVDAFCIASGFLLRVVAGGFAARYEVSHWLLLCTLFLALFLALCKRRAEIDLLGDERGAHRANLREYTLPFLDQMVTMLAATTIVMYTLYTVHRDTADKFEGGGRLIVSVPFVVFGLARYMFLVHARRGGGSPTRVLLGGDTAFVLNAIAWAVVVGVAVLG